VKKDRVNRAKIKKLIPVRGFVLADSLIRLKIAVKVKLAELESRLVLQRQGYRCLVNLNHQSAKALLTIPTIQLFLKTHLLILLVETQDAKSL